MSERNIRDPTEYMKRWFKRTAGYVIDDDMDFTDAMDKAADVTGDEVILDIQKDIAKKLLRMIFKE